MLSGQFDASLGIGIIALVMLWVGPSVAYAYKFNLKKKTRSAVLYWTGLQNPFCAIFKHRRLSQDLEMYFVSVWLASLVRVLILGLAITAALFLTFQAYFLMDWWATGYLTIATFRVVFAEIFVWGIVTVLGLLVMHVCVNRITDVFGE